MKRHWFIFVIILSLTLLISSCDIVSKLVDSTLDDNTQDIVSRNTVENASDRDATSEDVNFKDNLKLNPKSIYEISEDNGNFSIGPLDGYLARVTWISPTEFVMRTENEELFTLAKAEITEDGLDIKPSLDAPSNSVYINDILPDKKGSILISTRDKKGFYWAENGKLKEYDDVQYYSISPLKKYIVLFSASPDSEPLVIKLETDKESALPKGLNRGWPDYAAGMEFSPAESFLLYEDWKEGSVCIYDIGKEKISASISEEGYNFLEPAWSTSGKYIAALKWDKSRDDIPIDWDGRLPLGSSLVIYGNNKIVKEIQGKSLIWAKPLWSADGKYILINMAEVTDKKINGEVYLLNTDKYTLKKITTEESGTGCKCAAGWSEDGQNVLVDSISEDGISSSWIVNLKTGMEKPLDMDKNYISIFNKAGIYTFKTYETDNAVLNKYKDKEDLSISPDGKYASFITDENDKKYVRIIKMKSK